MSIEVTVHTTPNPSAIKFVANKTIKVEGTSFYKKQSECKGNSLASGLFLIRGVDTVYIQGNSITINKLIFEPSETLIRKVTDYLKQNLEAHDPEYQETEIKFDNNSPELEKIHTVIEDYIRPGLQNDGGDLEVLGFKDNKLQIKYQGACSSCPSSTTGTLMAIQTILKEKVDKDLEIELAE